MADTVVDQFVCLFRGRADVYGSWDGGCVKQPLTLATFRNHLTNGPHIGVYPTLNVNGVAHCAWGCTDIDYDDRDEAFRLRDTFAAVGITAWVERTRKGWHIWVFMGGLTPASDVRRMFLAAHQVAKSKPTEVNPKQIVLGQHGIGNYVRCPYPGQLHAADFVCGRTMPTRFMVDTVGSYLPLEEFTSAAVAQRATAERVAELADYYIEPKREAINVMEPSLDMLEASSRLTPLGRVIFRDGPLEGGDRSTKLQHLAFEAAKASLNPSDALMLVKDAEQRWGQAKYSSRGEAGEMILQDIILRAYGPTPST